MDLRSSQPLNQHGEDVAIFEDILKGIAAVKEKGFSVDGIIAINSAFDSPSDEQPNWPGHLRNAYYNEDDRIGITIDQSAKETYFPPEIVRRDDLQKIVDNYKESPKKEKDAWKIFADLSKLQPFQDGNKRTALIAANAAYGTFEKENYLVLPFNDLDRGEFTISLMRYYDAKIQLMRQSTWIKWLIYFQVIVKGSYIGRSLVIRVRAKHEWHELSRNLEMLKIKKVKRAPILKLNRNR